MKAEIITIGDELLIGQVIDTNSAWIAKTLNEIGVRVVNRTAVGDIKDDILFALHQATQRSNIVIITGGLGPTKDDVTKNCLCEFFNDVLVQNKEVLDWVTQIFKQRNLPLLETNLMQCMVPASCEVLFNHHGTAPGMWFYKNNIVYVSLPGVPYEMQGIFTDYVLPKLKSTFSLPAIYHRTLQTIGIGESFLAEKIKDIESELPDYVKLAYLPSVGMVRLRLSGYGNNYDNLKIIIDEIILRLYDRIGEYIFGEEQDTIEQVIGLLLKSIDATLSTAESCTGGYIAHRLTSVAGSSGYFTGSIIAYDNKIKINELGVSPDTISSFGAVSKQCVIEMANGIKSKFGTTYSIATSGIAGPDGGTPDKPVGTVWIAVAGASNCVVKCFNMGNNRERTIQRTTLTALDLLRKMILENA